MIVGCDMVGSRMWWVGNVGCKLGMLVVVVDGWGGVIGCCRWVMQGGNHRSGGVVGGRRWAMWGYWNKSDV